MARDYSFENTVVIPRTSAGGLIAMTEGLLAAAAAEAVLPESLGEPREWLEEKRGELTAAAAKQAVALDLTESAKPWDVRIDGVFAQQRQWLGGLTFDEPENSKRATAQKLFELWYGAGAFYFGSKYEVQWAEMSVRFKAIKEAGLRAAYEDLGSTAHLDALLRLHGEYGRALGLTAPLPVADSAKIAGEMDALADAIRDWIGKVTATRSRKDPATAERVARLLNTVAAWETPKPGKAGGGDEGGNDGGGNTPGA